MKFKKSKNKDSNPNLQPIVGLGSKSHNTVAVKKSRILGFKLSRRLLISCILLVLVIVVGYGIKSQYFAGLLQPKTETEPIVTQEQRDFYNPPKQDTTIRQLEYEELQRTVNKMVLAGQQEEAQALIRAQDSFQDSEDIRILLATLLSDNGNPKEALDVLLKAEAHFGQSRSIVSLIAQLYDRFNDKAKAISYYKKYVIVLKNSGDPDVAIDIADAERRIKELESE